MESVNAHQGQSMKGPLLPSGWPETLGRIIAYLILSMPFIGLIAAAVIAILGGGR